MALVTPGLAAWGVMTGVAMVKSGMSAVEVTLMALFVYAGSSRLAALPAETKSAISVTSTALIPDFTIATPVMIPQAARPGVTSAMSSTPMRSCG